MGITSKIFEFLGFEGEEKEAKRKAKKEKKVKASYNLKKKQKVEKVDNIDGIKVVYPEILDDANNYLTYIKNDEAFILSIEYCQGDEMDKIIAFLSGAVQMVGAKLEVLEKGKYYIILPEGVEIEKDTQ